MQSRNRVRFPAGSRTLFAGKRRFVKGDFTRKMKSPHKLDFALLFPVTFRNNEAVSTDFNKPFTVIHRRMDME